MARGLSALLVISQIGCTTIENYGAPDAGDAVAQAGLWRSSAATLYLASEGPSHPNPHFIIPDLDARRSEIRLEAISREPIPVELRCEGPAIVSQAGAPDQTLSPGTGIQLDLPARGGDVPILLWQPESATCQVNWAGNQSIMLRPESEALPGLAEMSRGPLNCGFNPIASLDPLQRVFLDDGLMLQTCPVAPGHVRLLSDPVVALNARIEALTGSTVGLADIQAGNPDLRLDFSNAPELDLIQLSYLHIRADYVGYLTARMLAYHAMRGTQVRILVTDFLMLEKDRIFYDSLAARYPNIQIQYYRWVSQNDTGPNDLVNQLHRVQHTRSFLAVSPQPGRSRFIFGGRNLHDGFFFSEPFDLQAWPYLHTYDEGSFQDIGFYSIYEDLEVELRDDHAVRNVAAHQIALWNRDVATQRVGPMRTGRSESLRGMRHYLSLPWADGRDQIRWFADAIDAATHEVQIVTPYLNPPDQIQAALLRAVERGVRVRIVARVKSTDPAGFVITALNRRYVARNAGHFEMEEYFPRPRMMHTKMMVIDRRLAVSTSTNLDHRAFLHDTENGLVFLDTPQVSALLDIVDGYRETTRQLTPDEPQSAMGDLLYRWTFLHTLF